MREAPQVILVHPHVLHTPDEAVRYGQWEELVSEPNSSMLQYMPVENAMLDLAYEMNAAHDREAVLCEQLNDHIDQLKTVEEDLRKTAHERDAYKRAKAENDERFLNERDAAREEARAAHEAHRAVCGRRDALQRELVALQETVMQMNTRYALLNDAHQREVNDVEQDLERLLRIQRDRIQTLGGATRCPRCGGVQIKPTGNTASSEGDPSRGVPPQEGEELVCATCNHLWWG